MLQKPIKEQQLVVLFSVIVLSSTFHKQGWWQIYFFFTDCETIAVKLKGNNNPDKYTGK